MFPWLASPGLLLVAIVLGATLGALRWIDGFVRSNATRRLIHRLLLPLLELAVVATATLWLLSFLAADASLERLLPLAFIVLALAWAGRRVLDDFVNGIVLRVEGSIEVGRTVRVPHVDGLVRRIGYRAVEIETDDGALVRLPFSRIAQASLVTAAVGLRAHTFTLEVPRDRPLGRILSEIPTLALLSPWSSLTRMPRVELRSETNENYLLEITTYSLDPAYASRIEATVRQTLGRPGATGG
jgi:small-conductance mechanosensitive channel